MIRIGPAKVEGAEAEKWMLIAIAVKRLQLVLVAHQRRVSGEQ